MTDPAPESNPAFGVPLPAPGWTVLDAAREQRFTGEIVVATVPEVRIYLDRGEIYLAERVNDPALGSRLVDAGAINAAQLEQGAIRLGEAEHLGRLFDRVPSIDRDAVITIAETLTDECVGWVADQTVELATDAPYRHHESGMHRWHQPADEIELRPGDPLPAPAADEMPIAVAAPPFTFEPIDDLISWDEPSWVDGARRAPVAPPAPPLTIPTVSAPASERSPSISADWASGLPGLAPATVEQPARAADRPASVDVLDRFEVIWPSGEIDHEFGALEVADVSERHPDHDRAGPTARLDRQNAADVPVPPLEPAPFAPPELTLVPTPPDRGTNGHDANGHDDVIDDIALAVRKTVASVGSGVLATGERPTATVMAIDVDTAATGGLVPPGRVAVRNEPIERTVRSTSPSGSGTTSTRSVFDEIGPTPDLPVEATDDGSTVEPESGRSGALRRLIGSLRRR